MLLLFPIRIKRICNIANTGDELANIASREAAQARIDQIEIFARELGRLRNDRVVHLTDAQLAEIAAYHRRTIRELTIRYDADASDGGRQLSVSMRIVSVLGAFCLGSTVFVLFYHFWAAFNLGIQTLLLCAAPTLAFALALLVKAHDRTGYFSRLSAALSYASFVLAVVILPRLWNMNIGSASVLACTVFGFVLAYEMRSRLQLCAALLGVVMYGAALISLWRGAPWWAFVTRPEDLYPGAAILVVVPALVSQRHYPDFAALYRFSGTLILLGTFLVLTLWPSLSYLPYGPHTISAAYKATIVVGGGLGIHLGVTRRHPEVTLLSGLSLLMLIGSEAYDHLFRELALYQIFLLVTAVAIGVLYILGLFRGRVARQAMGEKQ